MILPCAFACSGLAANAQNLASNSGAPISTGASANTTVSRPVRANVTEAATFRPDSKMGISTQITNGILTVDGLVVKARLNYDIHNAPYLYFFLPGTGTVIVSREHIPNSAPEKGGFHGSVMTVTAFGHTIELTSDNPITTGKPETAWVTSDNDYTHADRTPMMGFGDTLYAPYAWPGAKPFKPAADSGLARYNPPPLPASLLPRLASSYSVTVSATQTSAGK